MYKIERTINEDFEDSYIYKSKNDKGQIIVCGFYKCTDGYINFSFYITLKRKQGFQSNIITGKDGIKSLIWAKKCLIDFMEFGKKRFKGMTLLVYPEDHRRRKVYEYALLPLGFTISKDKYKTLNYTL